jgi:ribose 5-phosphate isomerase
MYIIGGCGWCMIKEKIIKEQSKDTPTVNLVNSPIYEMISLTQAILVG